MSLGWFGAEFGVGSWEFRWQMLYTGCRMHPTQSNPKISKSLPAVALAKVGAISNNTVPSNSLQISVITYGG
jgi:hypothetical protein